MMIRDNAGIALVTGAGRGIGQAIAWSLAEKGFAVVVNALPGDTLDETLAGIEQRGAHGKAVFADIADLDGQDRLVDDAWSAFGGLTCLVNNAGISVKRRGDLLEVTPESFDRLIAVNLRGPFFLTQRVASRMLAEATPPQPRTITTISSANTFLASPNRSEYCISKIGLSMMTKVFALRLAEAGINVYEIRPGVIRTAMTAVAKDEYDARYATGDFTPINRWGEPSEIGSAVAMLAEGTLGFATGEAFHIDGGMHIQRL